MAKRIGPQMQAAVYYVQMNPGCPKLHAAEYIKPQSRRYGYLAVDRAINAGLITAEKVGNKYKLTVA